MHPIAIALVCLMIAGVALWGWGWFVQRSMRLPTVTWPVTVALGLAAVIFIGGGLNLAQLARPVAFDLIVMVGIILGLIGVVPVVRRQRLARVFHTENGTMSQPVFGDATPSSRLHEKCGLGTAPGGILAGIPVLLAGGFVLLCLVPPSAYNVHDDLEKYFALPVRMLATGTLAPNPLGSVGAETLGAQAFLQAFVAVHFPVKYIGAFDGLLCLLLSLALVAFGSSPGRWGIGAAAAAVCAWLINPQVVNISSVYSGAALVATAVFLSARVAVPDATVRSGLLLGLVYAGLIALKTTFLVFVGAHLLSLVVAGWWFGDRRGISVLWAAGGTVLGLAPWIFLHLPLYLAPAQPAAVMPLHAPEPFSFFSRELSSYGTTQLPYTLFVIGVLIGVGSLLIASRVGWRLRSPELTAAGAAGLAVGLTYLLFMAIGGPLVFGRFGATRYVCPVLIGAVPTMMRLLEFRESKRPLLHQLGLAGVTLSVGALFWPSTVERPGHWWRDRTPLAFFASALPEPRQAYLEYNRLVFETDTRLMLKRIQGLVPAGELLGVWVSAPFLLDFRRNPVLTTDPAGLNMRWAHWPASLHYFLVQYKGYAVRSDADYREMWDSPCESDRAAVVRALAFLDELHRRADSAKIIYNDGAFLLMRTDDSTATANPVR